MSAPRLSLTPMALKTGPDTYTPVVRVQIRGEWVLLDPSAIGDLIIQAARYRTQSAELVAALMTAPALAECETQGQA